MAPLHPVLRFTLLCSAILLGALLAIWGGTGFSTFGLTPHGFAALTLGSVLTVILASALMGLLFHSEHARSRDEPPR